MISHKPVLLSIWNFTMKLVTVSSQLQTGQTPAIGTEIMNRTQAWGRDSKHYPSPIPLWDTNSHRWVTGVFTLTQTVEGGLSAGFPHTSHNIYIKIHILYIKYIHTLIYPFTHLPTTSPVQGRGEPWSPSQNPLGTRPRAPCLVNIAAWVYMGWWRERG